MRALLPLPVPLTDWRRYFSLFITYTPYTIYQYGFKGWGKMILRDGWKYFILAACDVEGNFLVVKVSYIQLNDPSIQLIPARAPGVRLHDPAIVHAARRMGHPRLPPLLLDLHAPQIPLVPARGKSRPRAAYPSLTTCATRVS